LILDTEDEIIFIPYSYDGKTISSNLGTRKLLKLAKGVPTKSLFVEELRKFYILQLKEWTGYASNRIIALPYIYEFDPVSYNLKEIINPFDGVYLRDYERNYLHRLIDFDDFQEKKKSIIGSGELLVRALNNGEWINFLDFEIP
jgi:hypothetical protein